MMYHIAGGREMASQFVSPDAMRKAVVLAGVGTERDARNLNLRQLREAWNDLSENERSAGLAAVAERRAEHLAQMGAAA